MPDAAQYTLRLLDSTVLGWALRLCPNNVVLQRRECPFPVHQRQTERPSRAFACAAAARVHFVRADAAVALGQLHHDVPFHPTPRSAVSA